MRIHARHYATGLAVEITCDRGRITAVGPPSANTANVEAGWVAPALFDLQVNGCDGISFSSEGLTLDQVRHVVGVCRRHGVSGFCPTVVTNSFTAIAHGLGVLRQACETSVCAAAAMPAFHLEGPYLSPEDGPRGAHPLAHIRPPDWDEFRRFQDAAGGRIRLVTLAPEHKAALGFIERLIGTGVVVAIGHTAAPAYRIREAVAAGARLSTHLGNGCHALLPRHDNYLWEQLAADELWASIICDGHHLPPAVVRCIVRVKTPARTVLISDASMLAGLPPGHYRHWGQDVVVLPEGKVVVAGSEQTPGGPGGFLAGSWAFADVGVGNVIRFAGVSLREAIDMASLRPRELLGLPQGRLDPGEPAELVLFDWEEAGEFRVTGCVTLDRYQACA